MYKAWRIVLGKFGSEIGSGTSEMVTGMLGCPWITVQQRHQYDWDLPMRVKLWKMMRPKLKLLTHTSGTSQGQKKKKVRTRSNGEPNLNAAFRFRFSELLNATPRSGSAFEAKCPEPEPNRTFPSLLEEPSPTLTFDCSATASA
ncbi:hypothetical protein R3P38DRAFT_2793168 [Favolaschia claudopus]|uniref:Uncharacterized protein n=1 Tax=Favolaschia claudopus TaxID=2862362 RepID=A0AAW0ADB5_9AGAR